METPKFLRTIEQADEFRVKNLYCTQSIEICRKCQENLKKKDIVCSYLNYGEHVCPSILDVDNGIYYLITKTKPAIPEQKLDF